MSKKNSEKEIEEAHKKLRGELKPVEKKEAEKSIEKAIEKTLGKTEDKESMEKTEAQLAEEQAEQEDLKEGRKTSKGTDLEDITRKAQPLPGELSDSRYVQELSHKPMAEIYKEIKNIYKTAEDKGYLNTLEQKQVLYLNSAVEQKIQDEEHGTYTFSEEAARAASVTQHLSATMMGSYKGKKSSNDMYKHQEKWGI